MTKVKRLNISKCCTKTDIDCSQKPCFHIPQTSRDPETGGYPPNKNAQNQTGNKVRLPVRDFAGVKMLVLLVGGWTNPFDKY